MISSILEMVLKSRKIKGECHRPIWSTVIFLASSNNEHSELIEAMGDLLGKYDNPNKSEEFLLSIRAIGTIPSLKPGI